MKKLLYFIVCSFVLANISCQKDEEFGTPLLVPVNYFDVELISAVEDGVWLRQQKFVYDNTALKRSARCVFPLAEEPLKVYKYNLAGRIVDSLAEPPPTQVLLNNFFGNQFGINRVFRIQSAERNVYNTSIFNESLDLENKSRVDFSAFGNEASFIFPQNCVKILSDQSFILPVIISENNVQRLAIATIAGGRVIDFAKNSEAIAQNFEVHDTVIDQDENVFMLLSDRRSAATIINYKLVVYEKAKGSFTEKYNFQNTAKIYKLALDTTHEKVHIINTFSPEIVGRVISFLSYSLKTKEASLSSFRVNSTAATAKIGIETIHENNDTLLRITGNIFAGGNQNQLFKFGKNGNLEPVLAEKPNQIVSSVKKIENGFAEFYIVRASSGTTSTTSLVIQTPDNQIKVFIGEGTPLTPNKCSERF